MLEDVARQRAIEGSDRLLMFLLKARRPRTYRERVLNEHTGMDGSAVYDRIEIEFVDPQKHDRSTEDLS